ncbi:ArnT family glycosyltransferase [Spirochaetota bacterium]
MKFSDRFTFFKSKSFARILLIIIALLFFFGGINRSLIRYIDDVYHAHLGRLVMQHNTIVNVPDPWYSRGYYFQKPTFIPALISLGQRIFPVSTLGSKLFLILNAMLCLLVIYLLLKHYFSEEYAWISVFILITTQLLLWYTRRCGFDSACTYYIALAVLFYFFGDSDDKNSIPLFVLSGFFSGLSVMTKGIMGLLAPAVICMYTLVMRRFNHLIKKALIMLPVFLVVVLPWHITMYVAHKNAFIESYLWTWQLSFLTGGSPMAKWGWWTNLQKVLENYWPWLIVLLYAFYRGVRDILSKKLQDTDKRWIILHMIWILFVFIVFQISEVKRYHFTLPAYTAMGFFSAYYFIRIRCYTALKKAAIVLAMITGLLFLCTRFSVMLDQPDKDWQEHKGMFEYINNRYNNKNTVIYIYPCRKGLGHWLIDGFIAHTRCRIKNCYDLEKLDVYLENGKEELLYIRNDDLPKNNALYEKYREHLIYQHEDIMLFRI